MSNPLPCIWTKRGLALHNSGQALLCCQSRIFLEDDQQRKINWHTHGLSDAWTSSTRYEIIAAMERGEQHPNCQACWDIENIGGFSKRQRHLGLKFEHDIDHDKPVVLDLKLGNVCNLSCRSCNPWVSSKWANDWWEVFEKNRTGDGRFRDYRHYMEQVFRIGRLSYSDENEKFWRELDEWFPNSRFIDIYGAEPMLIDRLFDVLQTSIDKDHARFQSLHFNTNGTIWDDKKIDILSKFKKVVIDISIDGLFDHFAYIRNGETWSTVMENLAKYEQLSKDHPNCELHVCITISLYNIYYADEIFNYFDKRNLRPHFNLAHLPQHVNIKALPDPVKQMVRDKLLKNLNPRFQTEATETLNYINESFSDDPFARAEQYVNGVWPEVVRSVTELDRIRKQDFAQTFPEFWAILEPYFKA